MTSSNSEEPTRFAHPFFLDSDPASRMAPASGGFTRMLDFIQSRLQPIPRPLGESIMSLADVIGTSGVSGIVGQGQISFHCVGDTGRETHSPQEDVANAMAKDFDVRNPNRSPAAFIHLGDVIYGPQKDAAYRREFYDPYRHYPGKIMALAGNHDGEVIAQTDPQSLKAFLNNFCAPTPAVPQISGTIYRKTMNQPGVYWLLDAPFIQIIGLYSNVAENPGFISGPIPGDHQKEWLVKRLREIKDKRDIGFRKSLVVATHHPPFSGGGHAPSTAMLADIDDAFSQAGLLPDLFLSGHSHNYQRYTRFQTQLGVKYQIPYIVAGCGGHNDASVPTASGQTSGDHTFVKSRKGFGYLLVTADAARLQVKFMAVDGSAISEADRVTVDLSLHTAS
jgi:hypothetical protein